jgi:hypothetical protein
MCTSNPIYRSMVTLLCEVGCFSNSTVLDGTGGGHCPAAVLLSRFHLIVEPLIRHGFHNAYTQRSDQRGRKRGQLGTAGGRRFARQRRCGCHGWQSRHRRPGGRTRATTPVPRPALRRRDARALSNEPKAAMRAVCLGVLPCCWCCVGSVGRPGQGGPASHARSPLGDPLLIAQGARRGPDDGDGLLVGVGTGV